MTQLRWASQSPTWNSSRTCLPSWRGNRNWGWATQRPGEPVEGSGSALTERGENRAKDGLCFASGRGAVASPDLANQYGGPNRLLRAPVRGVDRRVQQEPEPVDGVRKDMIGQASIRLESERAGGHDFQL